MGGDMRRIEVYLHMQEALRLAIADLEIATKNALNTPAKKAFALRIKHLKEVLYDSENTED